MHLNIASRFHDVMASFKPFETSPTIGVAVSGGSDSMALCLLLQDFLKPLGGKVIAVTVDHGLREESNHEAQLLGHLLHAHGIEHVLLRWEGKKPTANIQAKARETRYTMLQDWFKHHHVLHYCTGHHQDDVAEWMMIQEFRGIQGDGLAMMRPITEKNGLRLLRPLLGFTKQELQAYLSTRDQAWIEDPSNAKDIYKRNQFRKQLQDDSFLALRLLQEALHQRHIREEEEQTTDRVMVQTGDQSIYGSITLDLHAYGKASLSVRLRLLQRFIAMVTGQGSRLRWRELRAIDDALLGSASCKRSAAGCLWVKQENESSALIVREASCIREAHASEVWDNRFRFSFPSQVDPKELIIQPLNNHHLALLKASGLYNVLAELKTIEPLIRSTLPVVMDKSSGKIVGIPHLTLASYGFKVALCNRH